MSRSISQIYAEAVTRRNDYLQLSPLNSGRSEAKLSVINILTYIMSALIYSYEILLDVFQVQMARLISKRINGTARYYAEMALYFQYNPTTQKMDEMTFDDSTFQFHFKTEDTSHRIIAKSAYQNYNGTGTVIKVCKTNSSASSNDGSPQYAPLTTTELNAFTDYMGEIKFLGAQLSYRSNYGDLLCINATIVYNNLYVDKAQAFENVKSAIIDYITNLDFNGYVYYQSIIDALQGAEYITTISGPDDGTHNYALVTLAEYDSVEKKYKDAVQVTERCTPASGYLTCVDETNNGLSTLIMDSSHFIMKPLSEVEE